MECSWGYRKQSKGAERTQVGDSKGDPRITTWLNPGPVSEAGRPGKKLFCRQLVPERTTKSTRNGDPPPAHDDHCSRDAGKEVGGCKEESN